MRALGTSHDKRVPRSSAERVQKFRDNQTEEGRSEERRRDRDWHLSSRANRSAEEEAIYNEAERQRFVPFTSSENFHHIFPGS
jgi:hypothetical protein